jgi:hypothetical protein
MDDRGVIEVPGALPVSEVLRDDAFYRVLGARLAHPLVLGLVIATIVVAMILLGPSTDSRFIYTDF